MSHNDKVFEEITLNYYKSTSASNDNSDYSAYSRSIRRALGSWLHGVCGKDILDLGCGTGQFSWTLNELGAKKVIGIDVCREEVEIARSRVAATFIELDILTYLKSLDEASIDHIFALNIMEHLHKGYLIEVLQQCNRILKPNGSLIAMVPNATSPFGCMTRYWDITHYNSFTPSSVNQLQNSVGFKEAQFKELGPRPHGFFSLVRFFLWKIIHYWILFRLVIETGSSRGGIYTADFLFRLIK